MTHDASHAQIDTRLHQQQLWSMPRSNKVDECKKQGVENCQNSTCILFNSGCPLARRTEPETAKPTERMTPK